MRSEGEGKVGIKVWYDWTKHQLGTELNRSGSMVQFPVGAGSSHTKDFKNGSGPCLHGTQDEVGTTKHDWSARCQYNVTGWVSMWAYDMLSQ